jgi:transcriptional regulator with GAF, ATPase, and Fis domain
MSNNADVHAVLAEVLIGGERGAPAADRLCVACVGLLGVDAAAVSLIDEGESRGTFGASDEAARLLDALQFSAGEGPCLEASRTTKPVLVPDLHARDEPRWPAFKEAAERSGVRAVFAIPINVGQMTVGALDLFRYTPGALTDRHVADALVIAGAAAQILLDVVDVGADDDQRAGALEQWDQVASLARVDVYQATGMVMAQLDISPVDALIRVRAYAFSHEQTVSEVAQLIISRHVLLEH